MEQPKLTPAEKYRKTEKCKLAKQKYYDTKGKDKAKAYYEAHKEEIKQRSMERYHAMKMLIEMT